MDDLAHGLNHRNWRVGLEYIAAHVDARCSLLDCIVSHLEGVEFRQFLAAGDNYRHGARRSDCLEAFFHVVGLDVSGPQLGADARCQAHVSGVADQFLAHRGDPESSYAVAIAHIDQAGQVVDDCDSYSPPTNTCTAIAATLSRMASSISMAICSFESSFKMLGPPDALKTMPLVNVGGMIERKIPRVSMSVSA